MSKEKSEQVLTFSDRIRSLLVNPLGFIYLSKTLKISLFPQAYFFDSRRKFIGARERVCRHASPIHLGKEGSGKESGCFTIFGMSFMFAYWRHGFRHDLLQMEIAPKEESGGLCSGF